jgi:hypothetical protein
LQNLQPGIVSPFNSVVDYQRYVSFLAFSEGQVPTTTINKAGTMVTYKDVTLDIEKWINGLHRGVDDLKAKLASLSGGRLLPVDVGEDIRDDITESARGYGWVDQAVATHPYMMMQMLLSKPKVEICKKGKEGLEFNHPAMRQLMLKLVDFQFQLAILINALCGQPSRITELLDAKIRNSTRERTLFHIHGDDWLVTRRVKHENQIRREVFIPKKVPPALQELLDYYIIVVRPLEIDLARLLWGTEVAVLYHEYLFVYMGKRMEEQQFSQALKVFSKKYFGCEVGPRAYRQLVVAIARIYLGSEYEIYEEDWENEQEDALAEQAGHSANTRRLHYAAEHGRFAGLTSDIFLRFGRMSESWWQLTRFHPTKPALLPIGQRQQIRQDTLLAAPEMDAQPGNPPVVVPNLGSLTERLTATLTTTIAQMKVELEAGIQASVAAGCTEILSRQLPAPAPPSFLTEETKDFLKDLVKSAVADALKDKGPERESLPEEPGVNEDWYYNPPMPGMSDDEEGDSFPFLGFMLVADFNLPSPCCPTHRRHSDGRLPI